MFGSYYVVVRESDFRFALNLCVSKEHHLLRPIEQIDINQLIHLL